MKGTEQNRVIFRCFQQFLNVLPITLIILCKFNRRCRIAFKTSRYIHISKQLIEQNENQGIWKLPNKASGIVGNKKQKNFEENNWQCKKHRKVNGEDAQTVMDLYKRAKISQAMQFNHQNAKANNSEESVV